MIFFSQSPRWLRGLAALLLLAWLGGCATVEKPDPIEPFNRQVFAFNEGLDKYAIAPVATVYRDVTPQPLRVGVDNFFHNFQDAWSAINLLLQGRIADAGNDLMRFGLNSTLGFGGIIDWAGELGLERHDADFGITLGRWGFEPGAYLVWPLLGPSTVRDTVGLPADLYFSPDQLVNSVPLRNSLSGLRLVNARSQLLAATALLDDIVLDKYTFIRDAYLQRRRNLIFDGEPPDQEELDLSPAAPPAAASAPAPGAPPSDPAR